MKATEHLLSVKAEMLDRRVSRTSSSYSLLRHGSWSEVFPAVWRDSHDGGIFSGYYPADNK